MTYLLRSAFAIACILIILLASGNAPASLSSTDAAGKIVGTPCAPNGSLDETFNGSGIVTTAIGPGTDGVYQIALQPDGKIVAAGFTGSGSTASVAVARYNVDGTLDTTFGGTGKVITPIIGSDDKAYAVAIQSDGKIVAAGAAKQAGSQDYDFAVVRYNTDGSLDTSWGGTGKVTTSITSGFDKATSVAIQSDGRIVAAGYSPGVGGNDTTLVRYNANGTLDTSFGGTGKIITPVGGVDEAYAVAIQADGKIVSAGSGSDGGLAGFALVRYNVDGTLDTSFSGDGKVITRVGVGSSAATSIAIDPNGKIVAAGYTFDNVAHFAVVKYNTDGTRDTTWGDSGRVMTTLTDQGDFAYGVALQTDGKVVVAGSAGNHHDFAVVRYDTNGTLDTSWGGTGKVITSVSSTSDEANSVVIQPDGKIVAGGGGIAGPSWDFALVRYSGCGVRNAFDFDDDQRADVSVFRPSEGIWYLQRSTAGFAAVSFGLATDRLVAADFDGDRKTDIAVYRAADSNWYWLNSSNGVVNTVHFGASGDLTTPGDYDGDGLADPAIFRPSTGTFWYAASSFFSVHRAIQWGVSTDLPVPGDYDGDGKTDAAVYRPSEGTWYILNSSNGAYTAIPFGVSTDLTTEADFDGDSKTDVAVYRASTGTWYWLNSTNGAFNAIRFGASEDQPVAADYDGDGQADIAVFRPSSGIWYRLNSSNSGFVAVQFGTTGDQPTPAEFRY